MNKGHFIYIFAFVLISLSCQKERKIGGRVLEYGTNVPIEGAIIQITEANSGSVVVRTNSTGYYVYKPKVSNSNCVISVASIPSVYSKDNVGVLYPQVQSATIADRNRNDYDFYVQGGKRLIVRFIDTLNPSSWVNRQAIFGVYTLEQAESGVLTQINYFLSSGDQTIESFSRVGWNYVTGYIRRNNLASNLIKDSVFVTKPMDGLDTIIIRY
jgi:hypothetical protein